MRFTAASVASTFQPSGSQTSTTNWSRSANGKNRSGTWWSTECARRHGKYAHYDRGGLAIFMATTITRL